MFRQNTVFIIGAGAGADVKMPLGSALAADIIKRTSNHLDADGRRLNVSDQWLPHAFSIKAKELGESPDVYFQACKTLSKGLYLAPSIDEFLFAHSSDLGVQCLGKLAIARSILNAERCCNLYNAPDDRRGLNMSRLSDSWLPLFFRMIQRRIKKGHEADVFKGFSIINFNYDRCLEHFLFHALQHYFNISPSIASEAITHLNIFHPYGTIGPLPWQNGGIGLEFGRELESGYVLCSAAKDLRTFTEEIRDAQTLVQIRDIVSGAETLIFLGFHYHFQNLELLGGTASADRIFGTVFSRSDDEQKVIQRRLRRYKRQNTTDRAIKLIPADCAAAFQQYSLTWTDLVSSSA